MESELVKKAEGHPEEAAGVRSSMAGAQGQGAVCLLGFLGRLGRRGPVSLLGSGSMPRMALASVTWSCAQHRVWYTEKLRVLEFQPCWWCQGYLLSCSWSVCSSLSWACSSCSWCWACSFASWSSYLGSWGQDGKGRQ